MLELLLLHPHIVWFRSSMSCSYAQRALHFVTSNVSNPISIWSNPLASMNKWFMVHPFPMLVILVTRGRGFLALRMVFDSSCLCKMDMSMIWRRGSVNSNLRTPLPQNKNNWQLKSQYSLLLLMQNGHEHDLKERQCQQQSAHPPAPKQKQLTA